MNTYQITVQMSPETVAELQGAHAQLCALAAVDGPRHGVPLTWLSTPELASTMELAWTDAVQAYVCPATPLVTGTRVTPSASFPVQPGQQLVVTGPTEGTVVPGRSGILVLNMSPEMMDCGISLQTPGAQPFIPTCAFPLFPDDAVLVTPVEQVFLMFTGPGSAGTVVRQSTSPGVLVDLAVLPRQTVSFDVSTGWAPEPWAQPFPAGTDLARLLTRAAAARPVAAGA